MRSQGYHHSSPGLPEFTTVTRVPALSGATIDEFAAIGAAVPARASPGPATPTAAGTRSGIAGAEGLTDGKEGPGATGKYGVSYQSGGVTAPPPLRVPFEHPKPASLEGPTRTRRARPLNIPRRSDRPMCASTACSMDGRDTHAWVIRARGGFGAAGTTKPAKGLRRG